MKRHYPGWEITKSLALTMQEIVASWQERL